MKWQKECTRISQNVCLIYENVFVLLMIEAIKMWDRIELIGLFVWNGCFFRGTLDGLNVRAWYLWFKLLLIKILKLMRYISSSNSTVSTATIYVSYGRTEGINFSCCIVSVAILFSQSVLLNSYFCGVLLFLFIFSNCL